MKKGKRFKKEKKSILLNSAIVLTLVIMAIISILIINTNKDNVLIGKEEKEKIYSSYMSDEIEKLMNEDDGNLVSKKYLITDTRIERIRENTEVAEFKKEFEKEVKIYKDIMLGEEITEGIIKTGMILEERGKVYNLVVTGDINKDGLVNQIDISKIIRGEISDEATEIASKIGIEKIENKIVFGKFELESVEEVKVPEIELINGDLGKNDWYTSEVTLKINQKDENGTKTVYRIKGTEEKEETQVSEETITLSNDGVYKVIAYTYGKEGNKSEIAQKIIKINKTGIEATVNYSTTENTTYSVIATVTFNKEGITITNNEGKNTYEFTENGEFEFTYEDEMGRTGTITAKVDWIKQEEIVGQDGEWKYFINNDNTIQLTRYLGNKTDLIVPAQYDGYQVYAVGNQYATETTKTCYNIFGETSRSNTTIKKLTIEEGIKEIKVGAFFRCSGITGDLIIPDSVTKIGYAAFVQCTSLDGNLVLSKNLKEIHFGAFNACSKLTGNLNLPDTLEVIDDYSFYGCSALTGDLVIPNNVERIGKSAFYNCAGFNGTLKLSDKLEDIGKYAFYQCSKLTGDLIIPNNVKSIGYAAFYKCTGVNGTLELSNKLETIEGFAFEGCKRLTGDLIIPDSVTIIGNTAFQNCSGFDGKLKLPKDLSKIEKYTFFKCTGLTGDLIIPDGVTDIGSAAFYQCAGFEGTLQLSKELQTIEGFAFYHCSGFTGDLVIPDNVTSIGESAFSTTIGFKGKLKLSNKLVTIGKFAFNESTGYTGDLIIPDSVKEIGGAAFQQCESFDGELVLSKNLEYIGDFAFNKCSRLKNKKIQIPATLKKIGDDYTLDGVNVGLGSHIMYNLGAHAGNFEEFEVDENNQYFKAVDGVLYTKDGKRLVIYPTCKKNETYEILEGVQILDILSIAGNITMKTLIVPDSLIIEGTSEDDDTVINNALYSYNSVENIEAKETNPNYKSVDGVLYTKDMKEVVSIASGRTKAVTIPDGVETIRERAVYWNQIYYKKISNMYIPASLVNISDATMSRINSGTVKVEVSADNPVFTTDANNDLIRK